MIEVVVGLDDGGWLSDDLVDWSIELVVGEGWSHARLAKLIVGCGSVKAG